MYRLYYHGIEASFVSKLKQKQLGKQKHNNNQVVSTVNSVASDSIALSSLPFAESSLLLTEAN